MKMNREQAIKFYDMILEKDGNVSTKDLRDFGYSASAAEFWVAQMASDFGRGVRTRESFVADVRKLRKKLVDGVAISEIRKGATA